MAFISDKLKALSEIILKVEEKLGIAKFIQYVMFILVVSGILNFSTIVEYIMKLQSQIEKKEHERRLLLRDNLMAELNPLLIELRSSTGASRLLYFEYHNSTENFVGIPFKFANLVLTNQDYECPGYNPNKYKDINSGLISAIYTDLRKKKIIINRGEKNDSSFHHKYPNIHDFFFSQDGSIQQMFINIPGVSSPLGMIVLEWVDEEVITEGEWERIQEIVLVDLPRINALISQYTP